MTEIDTRSQAFGLVSGAVTAGLTAPWRVYLARGCRYLSVSVGDRDEWNAWRTPFGCPDLTVRVYDADGTIRRSSVAETTVGGCRVAVELLEDVDLRDLDAPDPVQVLHASGRHAQRGIRAPEAGP